MKSAKRIACLVVLATWLPGAGGAVAAVTCDQLGQLALSTEQLRDRGNSLSAIRTDIDALIANNKFTAEEAADIKKAINDAFLRVRTSNEIAAECVARTKK